MEENKVDEVTVEKKGVKDKLVTVADSLGKTTAVVAKKTTEGLEKSKEAVFKAIDQNGDGEIGIEDVILMGLKVPGIKINREAFLRKELFKKYPQEGRMSKLVLSGQSSTVSCKKAAQMESVSKPRDATISATAIGWEIYGSPLLRNCPSWSLSAYSYAFWIFSKS